MKVTHVQVIGTRNVAQWDNGTATVLSDLEYDALRTGKPPEGFISASKGPLFDTPNGDLPLDYLAIDSQTIFLGVPEGMLIENLSSYVVTTDAGKVTIVPSLNGRYAVTKGNVTDNIGT